MEKIKLSNTGAVTLPNTTVYATGRIYTKGNAFVTDFSGNEKVQLSYNVLASMSSSTGQVSTNGWYFYLSNAGVVKLANASISNAGLVTTKGGLSILQIRFQLKRSSQ